MAVGTGAPKTWRAGTLTYTLAGVTLLFCWLLFGDFAWSMRDRSVGPMSQWYLNSIGVSNALFGVLMSSLPALIGLIVAPIIGVKSDRHRGKWGRRIPFLLVTTPIATFGMIGLALTPPLARWLHGSLGPDQALGAWLHRALDGSAAGARLLTGLQNEMIVSVICFGVFWAAFEVATIAGGAVFGALINDVVPKQLIGRFFGLFRAVSLIDGIVFNYWLTGKIPDHFTVMLIVIGVFYGASFMWMCFKVKEGDYPPPPPRENVGRNVIRNGTLNIRAYFSECYTSPYYISVYVLITIAGLANVPVNTFALPYSASLGISMDAYGKCLALTYFISLGLSYFMGWLVDLLHPLRMVMATLIGYLFVMLWGGFCATTPTTFLVAWVLHGVLSGCYFTSVATLGMRLFPHHKLAQFSSAIGFISAPLGMVMAPLVGLMIDRTGNVYRHTFGVGAGITALALIAGMIVHRRFMRLGGPDGYLAPE